MPPHQRSTYQASPPPEGVLLRVVPSGDAWAEGLPPVPANFVVTVSFSTEESAALHGEALRLLGYMTVGVQAWDREATGEGVDFLVSQALLEARPQWWRALASQAERAFGLAHGPAQALLAPVLEAHTRPASTPAASPRGRRLRDGPTPST